VWAQTAPEPELVLKPTPPEHFFDYGLNKEMRWETMAGRGYLVPNDLFFVRNHTRTPRLDVATWRLKVEGSGVERPLELRYDDLLAMPELSVIRCIECAGNGRSFFQVEHGRKAPGTQWKLGAIGVAEWTGVPLRRAGWAVRNGRHGWTEEHAETPEPTRNVLLGECAVLLWAADHAGVVAMAHNALAPDGLLRQ
jgi:hypothetical protein